jgi:hypothetical protein
MRMRVKLITGFVLITLALALWKFMSLPTQSRPEAATQGETGGMEFLPVRKDLQSAARATNVLAVKSAEDGTPYRLNERTLVGTKWEREGFGIEFSADGKLLIGGRERARWCVEGSRVRLYRDATPSGRPPEEHWLDIVGNKLMWEGQELGRVP